MSNCNKKCEGCRNYGEIAHLCVTICKAPQSKPDHPDYEKYKNLLFTENCPLRVDNEFIYWS